MDSICKECHLEDRDLYHDGLCAVCHFGDNIGTACEPPCPVEGCKNNSVIGHVEVKPESTPNSLEFDFFFKEGQ